MVVPVLLKSVSCTPWVVVVNATEFSATAVNVRVWVASCALAAAGTTSAAVPPRTAAGAAT
jgi:hypothetical protein